MIHLIIGGARSGKSSYAEEQARLIYSNSSANKQLIYIATATAADDEMEKRIRHHQQSRAKDWLLIEEPLDLSKVLAASSKQDNILLIECMTLWLSNWLCLPTSKQNNLDSWLLEKQSFINSLKTNKSDIIIVSNEVGSGIIPMGELNREFVDQSGWLNQELAKLADKVSLVISGCCLVLK